MSELGKFLAFQATISLLKQRGKEDLIKEVYRRCYEQSTLPPSEMENHVSMLYDPFTAEEISKECARLVYPDQTEWKGEIDIIFQTIEDLHGAIPEHGGDWYFTGRYPTPGGYGVLNKAFINYFENKEGRVYDMPPVSAVAT